MISNLIKIFKNKFKKKSDSDFSITYVIPNTISDREAEDRVGFVDSCLSKTDWGILTKTKRYTLPVVKSKIEKLLNENLYVSVKAYYEYKMTGDIKTFRSQMCKVFTENLKTVALSSIDNNGCFELVFVIEDKKGNTSWMVMDFAKESEVWYLHGINCRG